MSRSSNLPRSRRRLVIALIAFGVLDAIALAVLLSPLVLSSNVRQDRMQALQDQVQKKIHIVVPPDQVQSRIVEARAQIKDFYQNRLPSENSTILAQLYKLAAENQVTLDKAKYESKDVPVPGLRLVSIDASMVGNYVQEVKFINALEHSQLLFLVDSVTLGEQTGGAVRLQLKLETYLKGQGDKVENGKR